MKCQHCKSSLEYVLIDLGSAPPSNAYLTEITIQKPEKYFPLKVMVCQVCWLVQAEIYSSAVELFNDEYAYFSSFSDAWLSHSNNYVEMISDRFNIDQEAFVVEIASNDGYLLQFFKARSIPCLGIEPTASTAHAARMKGIETLERFFGLSCAVELANSGRQADLMIANNVLAHVPDINDFVKGFSLLLKDNGVATFEFPHLLNMISGNQFDTIYHEHFSYLSFTTVCHIFESNGLNVFDVEEIGTHGGSIRVYAQKHNSRNCPTTKSVGEMLDIELSAGMRNHDFYKSFSLQAEQTRIKLLSFLVDARVKNLKVAGYGAAAKGNTLLNFCGVRSDMIQFIVDRNPSKQGKWMPGSRIPIVDESYLIQEKPDYIIIFPWNLQEEVINQISYVKEWGAKFIVVQPDFSII